MFEDGNGVQIGVTYETERAFRWLKILKNAQPGGQSAVRVVSYQAVDKTTVSTSARDGSNDSIVTVAYETTNSSLINIVSFHYLNGTTFVAHQIKF